MNITSEIKPPVKETIIKPLTCKVSATDYVSDAQCLVNIFFAEDFSPCPHKCTTIHMKGFHYVNKSSNVEACENFEDEICNGGPTYGTRLLNEFRKCLKPCKMITYKGRLISENILINVRSTLATLIFPLFYIL
jgi:hypothetical protein